MDKITIAFHTLGCKTNAYETQAMTEQAQKAGFLVTSFSSPADVYVINTCSVTAVAAQKSRQMLHRCKKQNPQALVAACGCYAQEAAEVLCESGIDLIIGNNEKAKLIALVCERLAKKIKEPSQIVRQDLMRCTDFEEQTISAAGEHVRAYVKIQDGCNRFCSYCIIPYLRGRSRSRSQEEILQEVKALAQNGIREIVLTGIDISDYRANEAPQQAQTAANALADLIFSVEDMEEIERIRLGSLEAGIITADFLEQIKGSKKLCPHFHLSLQSGCDATLRRMNRHYTAKEYAATVQQIRAAFPNPAITTDVIAGFVGETEEEFEETKRFVTQIAFSQMHVFPYSRRKGTNADRMAGHLTKAVKTARTGQLLTLARELQTAYMQTFVGQRTEVLIESVISIQGCACGVGYTKEYVRTALPCEQGEDEMINKIVTCCPQQIIDEQGELLLFAKKADS